MSMPQDTPGEVIAVRSLGLGLVGVQSSTLAKTAALEVKRLVLPKGREIPTHQAPEEITVHCLEGRVTFTTGGTTRHLDAGQMLVLAAQEPHSLIGLEDSSVLVTKLLPAETSGS